MDTKRFYSATVLDTQSSMYSMTVFFWATTSDVYFADTLDAFVEVNGGEMIPVVVNNGADDLSVHGEV